MSLDWLPKSVFSGTSGKDFPRRTGVKPENELREGFDKKKFDDEWERIFRGKGKV